MIIALIPMGFMGFQAHLLTKEALTRLAFLHMETIAQDHAKHLDAWLTERLGDVVALAKLPVMREAIRGYSGTLETPTFELTTLLKDTISVTRERSTSYQSIYVIVPGGEILASTDSPSEDLLNLQREGFIQRLMDGSEDTFGSLCRAADLRWHMPMGAKVRDLDGSTLGLVVAVLDVSQTIEPIMNDLIGLGETGETYLIAKEGKIISKSRFISQSDTLDRRFDTYGIRSVLAQKQGTGVYTNYLGRAVLGSFLWLPKYEWGLLAEMGTDEILWPLKWIKMASILVAILVSAASLLIAYIISRRIADPIREVAGAAQRMSEGALDQRISFSGNDEVGMLAGSFNTMAQQLSRLIHSLQQKEQSLQKAYDELMDTQGQLIQSERMAAIGELVACVAHEIRNPLSSVKLNLQIIETDLEGDETLAEHCAIALNQVEQLDRMISDLLNYSKPLTLEKSLVAVEELVNRSIEDMRGEIASRDIRVLKKNDTEPLLIMADGDKIVQVLVNVFKNAIESSPPCGEIEIAVQKDKAPKGEIVSISIIDQGAGISARNLQTIFQPFFTTKKEGTGLGLCIAKKIVNAHDGTISVCSKDGKGATVRLILPIA
ncbi:MAG: ATP-binding protein [Syntrophobacter sp.]